jgi:hypothetical protein
LSHSEKYPLSMLYSILSQINKGLRRIPVLRKSEMSVYRRCFDCLSALFSYSLLVF